MKAQEACLPWPVLDVYLHALRAAALANDDTALRTVLAQCVPGFPAPGLA